MCCVKFLTFSSVLFCGLLLVTKNCGFVTAKKLITNSKISFMQGTYVRFVLSVYVNYTFVNTFVFVP